MKYIVILLLIPFLAFSQSKGVSPITPELARGQQQTASKNTYAVVVGISDYQDKDIPDLRFADKDAEAFANFLRSPAGGALDGDHLKVLTNQNATAGRIAEALDGLIEQAKEGDQVIIYFSGHGDVEGKKISQPGFLLAWDAPSRVYMGGGTYSLSFLQEVVTTLTVQGKAKVTVITDACHAGKLAGSQIGGAQLTTANLAKQYANEVKILSCQPNEFSLEGPQWGGGRGVFSYHLVDGLFGLADRNNDGQITLGEIDRYLEDKVTGEAAPQSQVPILLGNKTDRIATVNANILADLKKNKSGNMQVFAATESRGFEEEILAKVDSNIRLTYKAFQKAIQDKRFFTPTGNCAEDYYAQLEQVELLPPLRGIMKRNYAAALQDEAQQAMNIWLKAEVRQLECIGKSLRLEPIPQQLTRAAELLGEGHYMYRSLQARRLLFEGITEKQHWNPDEALGRKCISLFRQSLSLEAQSALPWHWMSLVYANNLRMPDSAFICARLARSLAPNWVLPFADLGYILVQQRQLELAKQALQEAEAIDSLHPYVINRWAWWLADLGGKANQEKAATMFEKYRKSGGALYSCWFNDYGLVLKDLGRYAESEAQYKEAIALDSTNTMSWTNLGSLYKKTRRYAEAEPVLKKAIALDSTFSGQWSNLGLLYISTRRYAEAEPVFKKAIALDSTNAFAWSSLGDLYISTRRYAEAEPVFKKAIALDSTEVTYWNNLAFVYLITQRYAEAEPIFWRIVTADSTFIAGWNNLGNIYRETNRFDESEKMYRKAFSIDAAFPTTYFNYAKLKVKTGDTAAAFANLELAFQKGFNNFDRLQVDETFAPLRALPAWKELMKKYFPDKVKY